MKWDFNYRVLNNLQQIYARFKMHIQSKLLIIRLHLHPVLLY